MKIKKQKLFSKYQTSMEIKHLVFNYHTDLLKYKSWSLEKFFDFVKNIPYKMDIAPVEVIKRPSFILKDNAADCKKKSILCGAFLYMKGIPFRFIGSSRRKDKKIHHIFPQILSGNKWINFDATYPFYSIGQPKKNLTDTCIL